MNLRLYLINLEWCLLKLFCLQCNLALTNQNAVYVRLAQILLDM